MIKMVDLFWAQIAMAFLAQMCFFFVNVICFIIFTVYAAEQEKEDSLEKIWDSGSDGRTAIVMACILLVFCFSFFILQLQHLHSMEYNLKKFFSFWVTLDLILIGTNACNCSFFLQRSHHNTMLALGCLTSILLLIQVLYYCRGFQTSAVLVKMLITITSDMIPFLLLVLACCFAFSISFQWLTIGNEDSFFDGVVGSLKTTIQMSWFGEFQDYEQELSES
eukprot:UN34863